MMDMAPYQRGDSVDKGDSIKKRQHEVVEEWNHGDNEEQHFKNKHRHKHHRHSHGNHKKHKHEHRKKSSKVTEGVDVHHGHGNEVPIETRDNREAWSGKGLSIEQYNKEEGELSDNPVTNFKAIIESEVESGEIKSDGESAACEPLLEKLAVCSFNSGSSEATEPAPAIKEDNAVLVPTEHTQSPALAMSEFTDLSEMDLGTGHLCMSMQKDHMPESYASDHSIDDTEMVNNSDVSKATGFEVEPLETRQALDGDSENIFVQCKVDMDQKANRGDFPNDAFGKESPMEVNRHFLSVEGGSMNDYSAEELKPFLVREKDGLRSINGFDFNSEKLLSPLIEIPKNEPKGRGHSSLLTKNGEHETSKVHAPAESSKGNVLDGEKGLPRNQEGHQIRSHQDGHSRERRQSRSRERRQSRSRERRQVHTSDRKQSRSHEMRLSRSLERRKGGRRHSRSLEKRRGLSRDTGPDRLAPSHGLEQNRKHSPSLHDTQARFEKGREGSHDRKHRSRSRDPINKSEVNNTSFDRRDSRASLKSSRDVDLERKMLPDGSEKRNRRSRSRESMQNHRKAVHESMRHGYGRIASPSRGHSSRISETLKESRNDNRGSSRYSQTRHETSYKVSQTTRERLRNAEIRERYSQTNHSRGLEKECSKYNQSKPGQRAPTFSTDYRPDEEAREEENQENYVERVASQLAAQEEDDVERIKEESRRRRQAILEKYKTPKSNQQQQSSSLDSDMFREVDSAKEHVSEAKLGSLSSPLKVGHEQMDVTYGLLSGAISMHGATLVLGKGPLQKENVAEGKFGGITALGEGSPKSERSPDMFSDDIFGESPAGGRRAGKGDGLVVDTSGLTDNWDDGEGYYCYRIGEVLDGRYEVASSHGRGVFSHVVRARDLKAARGDVEEVAIKIIRNNETMFKAGQTELVILKKLAGADPENRRHCVRLLSSFEYRSHLCLVFESLHMNLREVLKKFGRNIGINLHAVRAYAKQLFIALKHLRNCGVLHCDIKPDNMLVNEAKNVLKLCDFGSAMFAGENEITPYLVSRFYRAPEIILGLPYDHALDIWSVGCCLYELYTGKVLFPGPTNNDMLKLHMELKGLFPKKMLKKAAFKDQHFDQDYNFCAVEEDPVTKKMVKRILANIKALDIGALIGTSCTVDEDSKMVANFKDLLDKVFILDPDKRLTVSQALSHPFITGK